MRPYCIISSADRWSMAFLAVAWTQRHLNCQHKALIAYRVAFALVGAFR